MPNKPGPNVFRPSTKFSTYTMVENAEIPDLPALSLWRQKMTTGFQRLLATERASFSAQVLRPLPGSTAAL
eukprot:2833718-Pleurochrysis_carterae.AAC.1